MTTVVTKICSVSFRKMQLLSAELRLLKGAIEQLHGRFDLLLAEIADLQGEHDADNEGAAEFESRVPHARQVAEMPCSEQLNPPVPLPAAIEATTKEIAAFIPTEQSSAAAITPCDDTPARISGMLAGADTPAEEAPVSESDIGILQSRIIEVPRPSELPFPEIITPEVAAAEPTTDTAAPACVGDAPSIPESQPCEIIDLETRRQTMPQHYRRTSIRTMARWAAAIALIASLGAVAAGTGFASNLAEILKRTETVVTHP